MPNTNSAKKRLRQNVVRNARNKAIKSSLRTQVKKVIKAVDSGDVETAETEFKTAAQQFDRAGARNIIHPNAAGRGKSRLQARIKKAKAAKAE